MMGHATINTPSLFLVRQMLIVQVNIVSILAPCFIFSFYIVFLVIIMVTYTIFNMFHKKIANTRTGKMKQNAQSPAALVQNRALNVKNES